MRFLLVFVLLLLPQSVFGQDLCSQLRSGLREVEEEHSRLCAEYWGTCAFLKTAEDQLRTCQGDDCVADFFVTIAGCALAIGWENCNYVGDRMVSLADRRERIENLAESNNCVLF